jgi:hypothetical protein
MTTKLTNVAVSPFLDGNTRGCAAKPKAVPPAAVPDYPSVFSLPPLTVRNLRIVLSPAPHPIHTVRRIGATAVGGFLLLFAALTLPSPACSLPDDSPYATPPVVREPLRWSTPRSPTNWPPLRAVAAHAATPVQAAGVAAASRQATHAERSRAFDEAAVQSQVSGQSWGSVVAMRWPLAQLRR